MIIFTFFHQSFILTSSEWSPTYLFPACIRGQSSAAHNLIPGCKTHIYCYSIWYTIYNLIKIKWAKKYSMKYHRHHQGFVSYLWKFMLSAVKVSAWQSLPPLSYSPESHSSVSETPLCSIEATFNIQFCFLWILRKNILWNKKQTFILVWAAFFFREIELLTCNAVKINMCYYEGYDCHIPVWLF